MIRPEHQEFSAFYASRQGQIARRLIVSQIRKLWPDASGEVILGIGHAQPFLSVFDEAARVFAASPDAHGARPWPGNGRASDLVIARERDLPFADRSIDRILLIHALELAPQVDKMLREVWRVLADGGRLMVITPNRTGLWGFSESTPFGHGQPYSAGQLTRLVQRHLFEARAEARALYMPPGRSPLLGKLTLPVERVGRRLFTTLSGLVMLDAEKRIYVGTPQAIFDTPVARRYLPVGNGLAAARDKMRRDEH